MKNNQFNTRDLAVQAMIAAVYVAITMLFSFMSFGPIQVRISEFMLILVLFNPKHSIGLLLGCAVANFLGSFALIDVIFGTLASAIAIFMMLKSKNELLGFLWPAIINGIVIGIQLMFIIPMPFIIAFVQVTFGEFLATFVPAYFLLKPLKNNAIMQRLFA